MRLLCDIHGVLADLIGGMLPIIEWVTRQPARREDVRTYYLREAFRLTDAEWAAVCREIEQPGFAARLDPIGDGPIRIRQLVESGLVQEVVFVTQPWAGSPTWTHDMEAWIEDHFPRLERRVVHTAHKHVVVGDLLLDDSYDHVHAWSTDHPYGDALLWDAPYNRAGLALDAYRVRSWDEVRDRVRRRSTRQKKARAR
jgi:5'(3')-deoxyribonucleotidase